MSSACAVPVLAVLILQANVKAEKCRHTFPDNFIFGVSTSSYQIEGSINVDGMGVCSWSTFTDTKPEMIADGSNAANACLSYERYKEDNDLVKQLGVDVYRISISWPRIMPDGRRTNRKGIDHYNDVINDMLKKNITPMITMYHWDLPQCIEDMGGWTNPIIIEYFKDYARVLLDNFGDRVKMWVTINEPNMFVYGYEGSGSPYVFAPCKEVPGVGLYLAGHNLLLAHAAVYHMYDTEYRCRQQGKISISIVLKWYEPKDINSVEDQELALRMIAMITGWFTEPIYGKHGDYPQLMKDVIGNNSKEEGFPRSRLPTFSPEEISFIKGTADYMAFNHYSTQLVTASNTGKWPSARRDMGATWESPAWLPKSPVTPTFGVTPEGFGKALKYIKESYGDKPIYITEGGICDNGDLDDELRVIYYGTYLAELTNAMCDGVNVKGYIAWSLMDNFEWCKGYTSKFGLYYVNFTDPARPRSPKKSARLWKNITSTREISQEYVKLRRKLTFDRPRSCQ